MWGICMGNLTYTNWEIQVYGMYNVKNDSKMESLRNLGWIRSDPDRDQLWGGAVDRVMTFRLSQKLEIS